MKLSVGTDITHVDDIKEIADSSKGIVKYFCPDEIESCMNSYNKYERFAGKFAAKEAFLKAVGLGILDGVLLKHIEVANCASGKPYFKLHKTANKALEQRGENVSVDLSISHSNQLAVAVVVIYENK